MLGLWKKQTWFDHKDDDCGYVESLADFIAQQEQKYHRYYGKIQKKGGGTLPDPKLINFQLSIDGNVKEDDANDKYVVEVL